MRRTRVRFRRTNLSLFLALAFGISPVRAASDDSLIAPSANADQDASSTGIPESSPTALDIVDERLVLEALQQQWARDSATDWLARAPQSEQKLWLGYVGVIGEGHRKLRDRLQDPKQAIHASLQDALREHGIEGDPDDYLVSFERMVEVGDIRIPFTHRGSLAETCLGTDAGTDVTQATVRRGDQAVSDERRQTLLSLLKRPSCRMSMAERLDRFKAQRSVLQTGYAAVFEAELRKGVLEAKLKGHLTGGRDAWIKGLDIVMDAMNDSAEVATGTLTLSTGPDGISIALPQWLVFVRKDAQGNEDGVTLYRPEAGASFFDNRQELFQYLDIHRLGQAVANECTRTPSSASAGSEVTRTFGHVVVEAAGPAQGPAVQAFFDDICRKPSSWGKNLRFEPYASHRFEDNMNTWTRGRIDLMLKDLERLASAPELLVLAADYRAVAEKSRVFNEEHVPDLREFARRNERDKLTAFFRREKLISDNETLDPDTISIDFNGRNMTWTDWVLEGYRNHGDNVFAESNNFMRDARLASSNPRIAARLNDPDVKQGVMANLRSTYSGDDYIKAVSALLDSEDPRRKSFQDLRVATQILEMRLAIAVERGNGNIDAADYRWLKDAIDGLPGSIDRDDVEIAELQLSSRRIPGMWVVSRKRLAGPGETRSVRESFVFVPDGPYRQTVYKEGPYFQSLLKTYEFKQYLLDKALTRDRQVIEDAIRKPYSADFRISLKPVSDIRAGSDQWLRDLLSNAEEATVSRTEVIRDQVVKGARFVNMGLCTAATGGAGVALCAAGTAALMGFDSYNAIDNLQRGRKNEALLDVAFLWADALDIGRGVRLLDPKRLLKLVGKSHFSSIDEAREAIDAATRQGNAFRPDSNLMRSGGNILSRPRPAEPELIAVNRPPAADTVPPARAPTSTETVPSTSGLSSASVAAPAHAGPSAPIRFDYEVPAARSDFLYEESLGHRGLDSRYLNRSLGPSERGMLDDFYDLRDRLLKSAEAALSLPPARRRPVMPATTPGMTQGEVFETMYRSADGLVIGETHDLVASKQILIDNMDLLKEKGVETVYLEHVLHDVHQVDLDDYFRSPANAPMPRRLERYLNALDRGFGTDASKNYTFLRLVETAKEHKVRVVSIDVLASYNVKGMNKEDVARRVMMNFQAKEIIEAYQARWPGTKWVALVGGAHANTIGKTPGLAELTGGIGIKVDDIAADGIQSIRPDPGEFWATGRLRTGPKVFMKSDFLLEVPVDRDLFPKAWTRLTVLSDPARDTRAVPEAARNLRHVGDFAIVEGDRIDDAVLYHRSHDRKIRETRIRKDADGFFILRPAWIEITGRRYESIDDLADALVTVKGMSNQSVPDALFQ